MPGSPAYKHEWYVEHSDTIKARSRMYYLANRDKIKRQNFDRYHANPEPNRMAAKMSYQRRKQEDPVALREASFDRTLRSKGRGTLAEWKANAAAQHGYCALCGKKKVLCWDHDHITGAHRGMICKACKTGLGNLGDTEAGLLRALAYLRGEYHVSAQ